MPQIVDTRPALAFRRFNSGAPQDVDKAACDGMRRVTHVALIVQNRPDSGLCGIFALRLASRYPRSADNALSANGRNLDLKNFVSRMVTVPTCRSISARFRRASSPNRNPAQ